MAADARARRTRSGLHKGSHALNQPPIGIQRLKVDRPPGGHLEKCRSVLLHRNHAEVVLHAERQRCADQKSLVVRLASAFAGADAGGLLDDAQPLDLTAFHTRQATVYILHKEPPGGRGTVGGVGDHRRPRARLDQHRRMQADIGIGHQRDAMPGSVDHLQHIALLPGRPPAENHHILRERPRLTGIARVPRRIRRMLEIRDGGRPILAQHRVDEGDRAARRGIVLGQRGHNQARIGHCPRIQDRLGEDHVVGENGCLLRAIGIDRPERLNRQRVLVDIFPAAKENPAIRQNRRIELVDVIHRDRMNVRPVRIHHVQDADALVGTRHQPAWPCGEKRDPAIGQIHRGDVVLAAVRAFVVSAGRTGIRQPPKVSAVDAHFVDAGVSGGAAFEAEDDSGGIPGQFRMRIDAVAR